MVMVLAVVLELVVFVGVGRALGFGTAVLLVFVASLLGLVLMHREGMRAWRGFRSAVAAGQPPGGQVTDGMVGLAGAMLLAVPGLVTGLVGLLLLVPPVRRLARAGVRRVTERRVSSMVAGDLFGPRTVRVRQGAPQPTPQAQEPVVVDGGRAIEGEIVEPGRG